MSDTHVDIALYEYEFNRRMTITDELALALKQLTVAKEYLEKISKDRYEHAYLSVPSTAAIAAKEALEKLSALEGGGEK